MQRRFLQRLRTSVPDLDHAHGVAETSPLSEIEAGPSGWPHCQSIGKGARDVPATLLARTNDRPSRACSGSVKRSRKFENPRGLGVPSRIFSTQSVRPDFSRVSGKRCPYCPRRWVTAQPSIRRSALLTSPPSGFAHKAALRESFLCKISTFCAGGVRYADSFYYSHECEAARISLPMLTPDLE